MNITIRRMTEPDAPIITAEEIAQGWGAEGRLEKYGQNLPEHSEEQGDSLLPAGLLLLY